LKFVKVFTTETYKGAVIVQKIGRVRRFMSIKENIVTEVYKDVISPIAKQIGSTAGEVAKLILAPIYQPTKLLNNRIDKCFERISKKVPKDKLMEAAPNISIPTIQGLALNQDDTLIGEMFFNILMSSVDKRQQKFNSPAFPKILEQLTRDECLFLVLLNKQTYKIHQEQDFDAERNIFYNGREILNELPIEKFDYPDNIWLYSDHLNHLNLAGCWQYKNQEPIFSDQIITEQNGAFSATRRQQTGVQIFSEFKLTKFGKMFCKVCVSEKCDEFIK